MPLPGPKYTGKKKAPERNPFLKTNRGGVIPGKRPSPDMDVKRAESQRLPTYNPMSPGMMEISRNFLRSWDIIIKALGGGK